MKQALGIIQDRWGLDSSPDNDDPILIFSAGWRSGSTLLQRLALSGNEALVWGEPYPYCDYIRRMAVSLTSFTASTPPDQFIVPEPPVHKNVNAEEWTACMYPHPQHLLQAHRRFFQSLYRDPARARGYARWGLKEVVLSTEHAAYLSWLFPAAKAVFLVRNPYDAYRSYRCFGDWYFRWPDEPVFTARRFGKVWKTLAADFLSGYQALNGMLLRYEDLTADPSVVTALASHLGTSVRLEVSTSKVTGRPPGDLAPIPALEMLQLRRVVEPLASELGYLPMS